MKKILYIMLCFTSMTALASNVLQLQKDIKVGGMDSDGYFNSEILITSEEIPNLSCYLEIHSSLSESVILNAGSIYHISSIEKDHIPGYVNRNSWGHTYVPDRYSLKINIDSSILKQVNCSKYGDEDEAFSLNEVRDLIKETFLIKKINLLDFSHEEFES